MNENDQSLALEKLKQLADVLPRKKRILIIPHNYPDPDALAAAAAMHLLLAQHFKLHSQIVFSGEVSRAENKELLRRFRYRWHRLSDLRVPNRNVYCILVDTAPWSRNVTIPSYAKTVAVIDHHQHTVTPNRRDSFMDIRSGAGATTTIVYEYLKAANIAIPRWLAAVMAYAIASETLDLSRDSEKSDLEAYAELAAKADLKIIGKIRHAPLPRDYFRNLKEAITNAKKIGSVTWSHLHAVEHPEIVAEIADLLLRMEGIHWSFCTANVKDGLFVSLRSNQRGAQCSRVLRTLIGRDGSAGGHQRLAAGLYELKGRSPKERHAQRREFIKALIAKVLRYADKRRAKDDWPIEPLVERKNVVLQ